MQLVEAEDAHIKYAIKFLLSLGMPSNSLRLKDCVFANLIFEIECNSVLTPVSNGEAEAPCGCGGIFE